MEIQSARKDVRTRQSLETQVGTVGTAPDRLNLRLDACHLHSLYGLVNYLIMRLNHLAHVIVLVFDGHTCRPFAVP